MYIVDKYFRRVSRIRKLCIAETLLLGCKKRNKENTRINYKNVGLSNFIFSFFMSQHFHEILFRISDLLPLRNYSSHYKRVKTVQNNILIKKQKVKKIVKKE